MIQSKRILVMNSMVKAALLFYLLTFLPLSMSAQPKARRAEQQKAKNQSNANNITTRSQISFPVVQEMPEDVVWRRDIYRELDLNEDENAGLYYPVEPIGSQMNLFTYVFKLMMTGSLKVYEYRLDGNEVFNDAAVVNRKAFLDNYHIYYERNDIHTNKTKSRNLTQR